MKYIALDLEFANDQEDICQLGLYDIQTKERTMRFVNLGTNKNGTKKKVHWFARKRIHGITDEMLEGHPEFPAIWKEHLESLFLDDEITVVGWSINNDLRAIRKACVRYKIKFPELKGLCAQNLIQHKDIELDGLKLSKVAEQLNIEFNGQVHHADADAEVTGLIYDLIKDLPEKENKNNLPSVMVADSPTRKEKRRGKKNG